MKIKNRIFKRSLKTNLAPQDWGMEISPQGELLSGGCKLTDLAERYGTPLHVIDEARLKKTALEFLKSALEEYPGKTAVHYAFKCNSVPAAIGTIREAGLKAEVMSEFELELVLRMGFRPEDIIVNGPCKTSQFLSKCIEAGVRFIVVDSIYELKTLGEISSRASAETNVLLRVNPDYTPRGMNQGSATGSRKGCAFGMDLKGGEVADAILMLSCLENVRFQGFHFHIGTGIHNPKDYEDALACLVQLRELATSAGFQIKVIDVGGGFASNTSRELTTSEMLLYQGFEKLPRGISNCTEHSFREFTRAISRALLHLFPADQLPELIYEPGRCIASPNQCLLLKVHQIKNRPGIKKWLITDGGLGTVSMPTFYEYHEVFLCNDVNRPRQEKVTITGPGCFAGDIVYRNIPMPEVHPGEILAIMDSGAYFTALESCFGYPRPAIAAVNNKEHRLVRRRETFDDMVNRDEFIYENQHERLPK